MAVLCLLAFGVGFGWWRAIDAERRQLRALPEAQRLRLYHRAIDSLKHDCDPAAPRSLRDFCQEQAELVLKLRECRSLLVYGVGGIAAPFVGIKVIDLALQALHLV